MHQTSASTPFSLTVVERPAVRIAGLTIRTDMVRAKDDCPALWHEQFGPRMQELCPSGSCEAYGASWVLDLAAGTFEYCAALPLAENATPPAGMHEAFLPAGLYAECLVSSLAELAAAYEFAFLQWLPGQQEYAPATQSPCYELYPAEYMANGRLLLYIPVIRR